TWMDSKTGLPATGRFKGKLVNDACPPPPVTTTPPPPAPQPTPPPPTPPVPTPTHRTTSCTSCQKQADKLNAASDKLAQDLANPGSSAALIADDQSQVKADAKALDDCEKTCKSSGGLLNNLLGHV